MKKLTGIMILGVLLVFGTITLQAQTEKLGPEKFTGNAILMSTAAAGATTRLTFDIQEYTSDEDVVKYLEILKAEGPDGLRKVLEKVRKGYLLPRGKTREPINLVRSRNVEGGRIIFILKTRYLHFLEFAAHTPRSREYNFTVIQLKVDENGEGEGHIFAGAKLEITPENQLSIEQRGTQAILVRSVKLQK